MRFRLRMGLRLRGGSNFQDIRLGSNLTNRHRGIDSSVAARYNIRVTYTSTEDTPIALKPASASLRKQAI